MPDVGNESAVAESLAGAVRRVGTGLGSEPQRVRAIVVDDLSVEARARRAEVDAVVMAAEESIPELLLSGGLDDPAAIGFLERRGLATEYAIFGVAVWRYALGLVGSKAVAPTLSATRLLDPVGSQGTAEIGAPGEPLGDEPTGSGAERAANQWRLGSLSAAPTVSGSIGVVVGCYFFVLIGLDPYAFPFPASNPVGSMLQTIDFLANLYWDVAS